MLMVRYFVIDAVFTKHDLELSVGTLPFLLMMISTLATAAAGYVLNDYYDIGIDQINCPGRIVLGKSISLKTGYHIAWGLLLIGMLAGLAMTLLISRPWSFLIYLFAGVLTWRYAVKLKRMYLWGNLTVSFLTALTIALPLIFEIVTFSKQPDFEKVYNALVTSGIVVGAFAMFAGLLNFTREIIKDIEDMEGDKAFGCRTIPLVNGQDKAVYFSGILGILILVLLLLCNYALMHSTLRFTGYYLISIIALMLYFLFRLIRSRHASDFHFLSTLLKIIMITGILSMFAWYFEYSNTSWIIN